MEFLLKEGFVLGLGLCEQNPIKSLIASIISIDEIKGKI